MLRTEYAVMETKDLIDYALLRDNRRSMEIELAQRLSIAVDRIKELEDENGDDPRGQAETRSQKRA